MTIIMLVRFVSVGRFWRLGTILGLLLVGAQLVSPGWAQAQGSGPPVCSVAKDLVDRGLPVHALALIDKAVQSSAANTPGLCPAEGQLATAKIDDSFRKAREAHVLLKEERWEDAGAAADAAIAANNDNAVARSASQAAKDGAAQAQKSELQKLQESWQGFVNDVVTPFANLLAPILGISLVLLAVSRLLVLSDVKWPALEPQPNARKRRMVLFVGLTQLVVSATALTIGVAGLFKTFPWIVWILAGLTAASAAFALNADDDARPLNERAKSPRTLRLILLVAGVIITLWVSVLLPQGLAITRSISIFLGVIAGLLGVFLTAWWLATKLQLEIKVTYDDEKAKQAEAALVTAFLYELSTKKPEDLEVPRGVEVTALAGALSTLPDNAVSKAIKSFLTAVAGTTPWVASIEGEKAGRTISVIRNGRAVASSIIDVPSLLPVTPEAAGKDKPADPLAGAPLRMAAAFVLVTLATKHPSLKAGLAGATDWQSVGLQYVATTLLRGDENAQKNREMLGRAVELDINNMAAQLAYRHATDRTSTDAKVLIDYREWLEQCDGKLVELQLAESAMRLRTCYLRTVVATNAVFAGTADESASKRIAKAREALVDLAALVTTSKDKHELTTIATSMETNSWGLKQLLAPPAPTSPDQRPPAGPIGTYNHACYYASKQSWVLLKSGSNRAPRPQDTSDDDQRAIALLRSATADPDLAKWMRFDPQLKDFRNRHHYRETFLQDPAQDIFACDLLKPFADRLRAAGYGNASVLAALHGSPNPLADVIAADAVVRRAIIDIAHLRASFTAGLEKSTWGAELLNQLSSRGLASSSTLTVLGAMERRTLARTLAEDLVGQFKTGESPAGLPGTDITNVLARRIRGWLRSLDTAL